MAGGARQPKTAILLVHGYLGLWPELSWARFAPLRRWLERQDCSVTAVRQPATAGIEARAKVLAATMAVTNAERLVLIGHSLGGLAARLAVHSHDPLHRVSDVVTLGTPHRGTLAAELFMDRRGWDGQICRWLDLGGLQAVRPERMRAFNAAVPRRSDVRYHAIAGARATYLFAGRWHQIARCLRRLEGENDGLVSIRSAQWGSSTLRVEADHLDLIGLRPLAGQRHHRGVPRHFAHLRALLSDVLHAPSPVGGQSAWPDRHAIASACEQA